MVKNKTEISIITTFVLHNRKAKFIPNCATQQSSLPSDITSCTQGERQRGPILVHTLFLTLIAIDPVREVSSRKLITNFPEII